MPRALVLPLLLSLLPLSSLSAQSTSDLARALLGGLGHQEYAGNEVTLLMTPQEKYDSLFASVRRARSFVHLEYYWIGCDSVGRALASLLLQKVRQGVEVRVLIDGYANRKNGSPWTPELVDSLRGAGLGVAIFDPVRFPWVNHISHRDHRKIAVVDGTEAYTGGMNIADYYLTGTERSGRWNDIHVRIEGPSVAAFETVFASLWGKVTGERLDTLCHRAPCASGGDKLVSVVNREPRKLSASMRRAYVAAIDAAASDVRVVNPYMTDVRSVRRALFRAMRRGVRVQVVASASSDVRVTPCLIAVEMRKLSKRGAEVYFFNGGFHHGKVMMVDGQFCTVGSANLDGRSMRRDYELNAFVFDRATTSALNSAFELYLQDSDTLSRVGYRSYFPLRQRLAGRVLAPFRGLF